MLTRAHSLCEQMITRFYDEKDPGFFATEADAPGLLVRARSNHDDAVPSGASFATAAILYVGTLLANTRYIDLVDRVMERHAGELMARPSGYASLVVLLQQLLQGFPHVVIAGDAGGELAQRARSLVDADVAVFGTGDGAHASLVDGKKSGAYVCTVSGCQPPATDAGSLRAALVAAGLHPSSH